MICSTDRRLFDHRPPMGWSYCGGGSTSTIIAVAFCRCAGRGKQLIGADFPPTRFQWKDIDTGSLGSNIAAARDGDR